MADTSGDTIDYTGKGTRGTGSRGTIVRDLGERAPREDEDDPVGEFTLSEFKIAIAEGFRMAQGEDYEAELTRLRPGENIPTRNLSDFIESLNDPDVSLQQKKQNLIKQFEEVGAQYIQFPNETNRDIVRRLDFIKKIKIQNEAYASMRTGEPLKLEKGFIQTSEFSQEKILSSAVNGSPTSKIIRFTNGISEVKIVPDGNGQYFGVQSGKRFGPGKFPDIERWAQRGGFEANEKRELKNIMDAIKDPEKMKAVVFRARKL